MTDASDECRTAFEEEFAPRGYSLSHNGSIYEDNSTEMAFRGFASAWNYGTPKKLITRKQFPQYATEFSAAQGYRLRVDGDVVYHEPIPEDPTLPE